MRSEHDVRSMIDYLTARDPQHPDLSAFRWVLGESPKSEPEQKFEVALKEIEDRYGKYKNEQIAIINKQTTEIADLKEKLHRFLRDGMVPRADFETAVEKEVQEWIMSEIPKVYGEFGPAR